jgi:hypothetical protein
MSKYPPFESLEDTARLIAKERNEAGCFIITKHHDGSYSFMNRDSLRYGLNHDNAIHSGHLGIYDSFIFEEMECTGWEH